MFEESGASKIDLSNWQKQMPATGIEERKGERFCFSLAWSLGDAMSWDRSGKGGFQYIGFLMGSVVLWRGDMGHSTNLSLVTNDLT